MVESGRRPGMGRVNIAFGGFTRFAQNASERAHRAKVEAGGNWRATSLASRSGFWFHGPKSFIEKDVRRELYLLAAASP